MIRGKFLWGCLLFISLFRLSPAQDFYFSQFYNSPLTLNPALAGFHSQDLRVVLNYRDNNKGLIPSNTFAFGSDIKIAPLHFNPDVLSTGLLVIGDRFMDGAINKTYLVVPLAYHYALGDSRKHFISLGMQFGAYYFQTNPNSFSYHSQWTDEAGYDPYADNNEDFERRQYVNPELNAGIMWYGRFSDRIVGIFGASAFHLLEPDESLLGNQAGLDRRYVVHGGPKIIFDQVNILPNMVAMLQAGSWQIAEGANVEYKLTDQNKLSLGAWYRHSDRAFIFSAGFEWKELFIGLSSDFMSSLQTISETSSVIEFSLSYSLRFRKSASLRSNPRNKY